MSYIRRDEIPAESSAGFHCERRKFFRSMAPGPSSANGVTVVEYYTAHGDAAIWQAVLAGFGIVCFLWFAGTFAATLPSANAVLVSAGAMAAIYLVTLGAWEALAETYKDVDILSTFRAKATATPTSFTTSASAPHTLASFANAAFVGATAVALLSGAVVRWRRLGWVGVGLTVVWLINAPLQIFGTSDWSDAVGAGIFVSLLAWVFALSVILVMSLRSDAVTSVPRTPSIPGRANANDDEVAFVRDFARKGSGCENVCS